IRVFGDDGGAALAPLENALDVLEIQAVLVDRHVVTGEALGVENGIDVAFEIDGAPELHFGRLNGLRLGVFGLLGTGGHSDHGQEADGPQTTRELTTHSKSPSVRYD